MSRGDSGSCEGGFRASVRPIDFYQVSVRKPQYFPKYSYQRWNDISWCSGFWHATDAYISASAAIFKNIYLGYQGLHFMALCGAFFLQHGNVREGVIKTLF